MELSVQAQRSEQDTLSPEEEAWEADLHRLFDYGIYIPKRWFKTPPTTSSQSESSP